METFERGWRDRFTSHRVVDQKLCPNDSHVTASTDEKRDISANNTKARGCKSSSGSVSLSGSRLCLFVRPVLRSSYPPVPLVFGWLSFIAGSRVVTKSWLVIKHCTSPFPAINPVLEVEVASCADNYRKKSETGKRCLGLGTFSYSHPACLRHMIQGSRGKCM